MNEWTAGWVHVYEHGEGVNPVSARVNNEIKEVWMEEEGGGEGRGRR
jgi:hypothetical protein